MAQGLGFSGQAYANNWAESMRFTIRNIVKRKNAAVPIAGKAFTLRPLLKRLRKTMAIGTWEPDQDKPQDHQLLNNEFLERAIATSNKDRLEQLEHDFDAAEQQQLSAVMRLTEEHWLRAVDTMSSENIYHLMRFLTAAEMAFSGWDAGQKSPVIVLNRLLKKRGEPLLREQVLWIKSNTSNRYLPNGAVL